MRTEHDLLGSVAVADTALYGIHTARALENFPLARRGVHPSLKHAFGVVKLACATVNRELGVWENQAHADAIQRACTELWQGMLDEHIVVDALQGGAGTSTNMNVNEVLANRALALLGFPLGSYEVISPLDDINRHQSTNDTFPTAVRIAALGLLRTLEHNLVALQEAFQAKEREFADVVKIARTQFQDAVLITLGREMGAYAEAINRDRWRVYKCEERLRVVNLGGTAVGTGLGAPRQYIFRVVDRLRELSGFGVARSENLVDATQNLDVFVEVMGIVKACSVSLVKICNDLRLLSSGPDAGLGEIRLPPRQAGSSIMPGKVNPVIPEAVSQAAMMVGGYEGVCAQAAASGSLELNPFMPLIADCVLNGIDVLSNAVVLLRTHCVEGIEADRAACRRHVDSATAAATALIGRFGYEAVTRLVTAARAQSLTIRQAVAEQGLLSEAEFDELLAAEAVCRLGSPQVFKKGE